MDGIKLSVALELPKEKEYKPSLIERVEEAKEKIEYGITDRDTYAFLRRVYNCAAKCYKAGKKSDNVVEILKRLTPFVQKHGLHDPRGMDIVSEFIGNTEYEDNDEDNSVG